MPSGHEVAERTNYESPIKELISKYQFLEFDDNEMENVNKGAWKVSKYAKHWMKNVFDEWKLFCGFNIMNFIANLSEVESLIKDLVDMLSFFVLQVTKKMAAYILQPGIIPYHFLNFFIIRFFFFIICFFLSILFMLL